MSANIDTQIQIMQDNLSDLRKIAGWTSEMLAGKLGITKQTISNLENHKVKLSRIQYIAIRSVFECEIASNPSNTTLRKVMGVLFQSMPPVYAAHKDSVRTAMLSIASIAAAGLTGMPLHASAIALLAPLGAAASQIPSSHLGEPSLRWLQEVLDLPDKKETGENTEEVPDENDRDKLQSI